MQAFEALWNEYIRTGQQLRILCGAELIDDLIRQLEMAVRRLHLVRHLVLIDLPNGSREFRNDPRMWPFLLHTCSWSSVSDPRDKVYGTLGLFNYSLLEPDYDQDVRAAYTNCTFHMLYGMGSLALLSQAISRVSLENGLPSWVPDWREPTTTTAPFLVFHDLFNAGRISSLVAQLVNSDTLRLKTALVDEVDEVGSEYDHQQCTQAADLPSILRPVMENWLKFSKIVKSVDRSFTACFTVPVSANLVHEDRPPPLSPNESHLMRPQSFRAPFYRDVDYNTQSFRAPF